MQVPLQANADKVVFVHGLAGFGPDELLGVSYVSNNWPSK
jgi:hypothetical protein